MTRTATSTYYRDKAIVNSSFFKKHFWSILYWNWVIGLVIIGFIVLWPAFVGLDDDNDTWLKILITFFFGAFGFLTIIHNM